jgi:hypothetical protein
MISGPISSTIRDLEDVLQGLDPKMATPRREMGKYRMSLRDLELLVECVISLTG